MAMTIKEKKAQCGYVTTPRTLRTLRSLQAEGMTEVCAMRAFEMDDEPTIYAAADAEEAIRLYEDHAGPDMLDLQFYPRELTDQELDAPRPELDEDERPTGRIVSIRMWLQRAIEPGWLCGVVR